jgi:hypothetical protein
MRLDDGTIPRSTRSSEDAATSVVRIGILIMICAPIGAPTDDTHGILTTGSLVPNTVLSFVAFLAASPTPLHSRSVEVAGASSVAQR